MRFLSILFLVLIFACTSNETTHQKHWVASAPAGADYTQINRDGKTVIPNGRFITPIGKQITVAPHPFGLALSPDGKTIATPTQVGISE